MGSRENLHMTLKFMGDVPDESSSWVPTLRQRCRDAPSFASPDRQIHLRAPTPQGDHALDHFPGPGEPQPAAFRIEMSPRTTVVVPEPRFFNPHITLVRTRSPRAFTAEEPATAAIGAVTGACRLDVSGSGYCLRKHTDTGHPFTGDPGEQSQLIALTSNKRSCSFDDSPAWVSRRLKERQRDGSGSSKDS